MLIDQVYLSHGGLPLQAEVVGRFYLTNWNYASDVTHWRDPGAKYVPPWSPNRCGLCHNVRRNESIAETAGHAAADLFARSM